MLVLPATPLFGREQDLQHLRQLISPGGARLITLTGVGGAGKSRLAQAVAADVSDRFDHVNLCVDLAPVQDAQLVPTAIAQALGVQESGARGVPQILRDLLRHGSSLVVLDNFEQVMDAALFVADLLACCPGLVVLVTSREALGIRYEQVYEVEPLAVPPSFEHRRAAVEVPALALFEERARARRAGFAITDENVECVAEICRRLDGLPLAIELAAAQVAVFSPPVILDQLRSRTPFLLSGPRDLPARHQTLGSAMAWSYDLLDPLEQAMFRWCGVFAGSFTADALDAIRARVGPPVQSIGVLAQLVTKSLIRSIAPETNADDSPRFDLLQTIRGFALQQLEASSELDEARRAHAVYYVTLAEELQPKLRGDGMAEALVRLSNDYANFREVFHWSSETGDLSVGLRLAGALYRFWLVRGHLAEARQWLEPALAHCGDGVAPRVRGVALNAAGVLAGMQHDHPRATQFFQQSLELWERLGEPGRMADAYLNLGLVAHNMGDFAVARAHFERAETLFEQVGDRAGLGRAVGSLARLARETGEFRAALSLFERCLVLFREAHDDWGVANALHNLGNVHLALLDAPRAKDFFRQALQVRLGLGTLLGVAECLEGFAAAAVDRQPRRAVLLLGAADAMREQAGAPVPAADQGRYADLVNRARLHVGEDVFTKTWGAGRALTMDRAVEIVLGASAETAETAESDAEPARDRSGGGALTRREREIAQLVAAGRSNREIAQVLVVTLRTVESHLEHIFRKLHFRTRAELAVWAVEHARRPAAERPEHSAPESGRAAPR